MGLTHNQRRNLAIRAITTSSNVPALANTLIKSRGDLLRDIDSSRKSQSSLINVIAMAVHSDAEHGYQQFNIRIANKTLDNAESDIQMVYEGTELVFTAMLQYDKLVNKGQLESELDEFGKNILNAYKDNPGLVNDVKKELWSFSQLSPSSPPQDIANGIYGVKQAIAEIMLKYKNIIDACEDFSRQKYLDPRFILSFLRPSGPTNGPFLGRSGGDQTGIPKGPGYYI